MSEKKAKEDRKNKKIGASVMISIRDRIVLSQLFPVNSDRLKQLIIKDLQEKLELSEDEKARINFKEIQIPRPDGNVLIKSIWGADDKGKKSSEIEEEIDIKIHFTGAELEFIKECVRKTDSDNKVTQFNLATINKFWDIPEIQNEIME